MSDTLSRITRHMEEPHLDRLWHTARAQGMPRRRFLGLLASGGTASVLVALSGTGAARAEDAASGDPEPEWPTPAGDRIHVKPLSPAFLIPHGTNAEMLWEVKAEDDSYTMDSGLFFVRNHTATPIIDRTRWRLHIEGPGVSSPLSIGYDELLAMPSRTVTRFVECAGNARSFYDIYLNKPGSGTQWHLGGYGVATWTGVPLGELLDRAGVKSSAVSIMGSGLDPSGFKKPTPIDKAMADDTLVVYGMNGAPLPYDHGFPARLLVPGWIGSYNVKWLGSLLVGDEQLYSKWNTTSYVLMGPEYQNPPGPSEGPVITWQTMKSSVALPWPASLSAGRRTVKGYAWSGQAAIDQVEISLDEGKTYRSAELVGPNIAAAGARWQATLDIPAGTTSITPRATDQQGNQQPAIAEQVWNKKGYVWGAVVPHPVEVAA